MKNKYSKILVLLTVIVLVLSFVSAEASNREDNKAKLENNKANEPLDKITFIYYKDGTVKEVGREITGRDKCYKLLGVKWSSLPVRYVINPSNSQGLSESFVTTAISTSAETWDAVTSRELFNNVYTTDPSATWDDGTVNPVDYRNEYVFGYYLDSRVIAVTVIWYTRYGMRIVDYDVLFNTQFNWDDATINPLAMDLQNIATHETGHGVGLSDIYSTSCSQVTMYGYSNEGDTIKRTLEKADITGLQKMYGI